MEFFADGECVGEVENLIATPEVEFKWVRWGRTLQVKLPGVQATLWKSPKGRLMIAVANHTSSVRSFKCDLIKDSVEIAAGEVKLIKLT